MRPARRMLIYAATRWLARYRDHGSACGLEAVEQRGRFTRRVVDATKPAAASVDERRRQVRVWRSLRPVTKLTMTGCGGCLIS
jgi:hypothetical protein